MGFLVLASRDIIKDQHRRHSNCMRCPSHKEIEVDWAGTDIRVMTMLSESFDMMKCLATSAVPTLTSRQENERTLEPMRSSKLR